jgi:hypothetical protein
LLRLIAPLVAEFLKAFKVFDKEDSGYIAVGEIKYILTQLGERMDEGEVEEVLKMADVGPDGQVNYEVRRNMRGATALLRFGADVVPHRFARITGLHQVGACRLNRSPASRPPASSSFASSFAPAAPFFAFSHARTRTSSYPTHMAF